MNVYVISEIGINHNGNLDLAKKMILESQKCGANAAKFQKRDIDLVYSKKQLSEFRESPWGKTQRDQKEGLEFNQSDYEKINDYCKKIKFDWFASAWEKESLKFLEQFKLKYNKIASAMIIESDFLELVAKEKKHTFISTGMSNMTDIENAVNIFRKNNCSFELMHCVSTYPMNPEDANLVTINALKEKFKCNVGYSGHENGVAVSLAAVYFNITSLERHITLDRTMYGSDQAASLEFTGMKTLSGSIKKMKIAFGTNKLGHVTDEEKIIAQKLRSHIIKKN